MINVRGIYKDYAIEWGDFSKFSITKEGVEVKKGLLTLDACVKWIDSQYKVLYKRIPVLTEYIGYSTRKKGDPFFEAEATSIVEGDVWIVDGKDRSKRDMRLVYPSTPSNRGKIAEMLVAENKIITLNAEIKKIYSNLDILKPEMMIIPQKEGV